MTKAYIVYVDDEQGCDPENWSVFYTDRWVFLNRPTMEEVKMCIKEYLSARSDDEDEEYVQYLKETADFHIEEVDLK